MNWVTRVPVNQAQEDDDRCPHVEDGSARPYRLEREMDSFGPVAGYLMCEACAKEQDEKAQEELVICHDCGGEFKVGETIRWKPYYFYAPQGDEPLIICHGCAGKAKHQRRVARDRRDYEAEMDYYDNSCY